MRRQATTPKAHAIRPVYRIRLMPVRQQRMLLAVLVLFTMAITATGAFAAGRIQPQPEPQAVADRSSITAFENRITARDNAAIELEKVNLVSQLNQQRAINELLSETIADKEKSIAAKDQTIVAKEKSMDTLEDTILKSLLANLEEKTLSRGSATLDSFIREARSLVDLSKKLKRFKNSKEAAAIDLSAYEREIAGRLSRLPTLKPISGGLDGYGWRIHPIFRYRQFHGAVDMGAPTGTPIKAAAAGRIIEAGYSSSAGNFVKISHGNGFVTAYLHCSKLNVQTGMNVSKGQVVGLVGNTGNSTKPHLHFAIELDGEPLNPASIIME